MRLLFILLSAFLLSSCQPASKPLPAVRQGKELVVVTYNSPSTYYVDGQNNFAGLEYDLAKLFAKDLGDDIKIKFLLVDNIGQVIPALLKGKAHIAAAGLSITHLRQHLVRFGEPYQNVQQQVVYNLERGNQPSSTKDLAGKQMAVPAGSSYAERLKEISQLLPELHWEELKNASTDELLEKVADGEIDYTISDSRIVAMGGWRN